MSPAFIRSTPVIRGERFDSVLRDTFSSTYVSARFGSVAIARSMGEMTAHLTFDVAGARALAAELLAAADAAERPDEQVAA